MSIRKTLVEGDHKTFKSGCDPADCDSNKAGQSQVSSTCFKEASEVHAATKPEESASHSDCC